VNNRRGKPVKRTLRQSGSQNVISDYDPIAEFEREIAGGPRLDGNNYVISDYDPIAEFEREIEGRPRPAPPLAPRPKQPRKRKTTDDALVAAPTKELTPLEKYKRFTEDDDLVTEGVQGIRSGTWPNPLQAAMTLAARAKGSSLDSTITRLRKKISVILEG
jgi:hypothetical protein